MGKFGSGKDCAYLTESGTKHQDKLDTSCEHMGKNMQLKTAYDMAKDRYGFMEEKYNSMVECLNLVDANSGREWECKENACQGRECTTEERDACMLDDFTQLEGAFEKLQEVQDDWHTESIIKLEEIDDKIVCLEANS